MGRRAIILFLVLGVCLWGLRAWADDDAIIDIDNHIATLAGTWGTNNTPILFYGDDFRWAACSGSTSITAEATFSSSNVNSNGTPIYADLSGNYAVYVRWVVHPNRTTNAKYRIFNGATQVGTCTTTMNQQIRGGEWIYCNTVVINLDNTMSVKLGNDCEAGKYVVADAVRFVRVSKDSGDITNEPGFDFRRISPSVAVTATSQASPTQVISQTITCPRSGYIVATVNGNAGLRAATAGSYAYFWLSLSQSTTWDTDNDIVIGGYYANNGFNYPGFAMSRMDSCSGGDSRTYYLLAYYLTGTTDQYVGNPALFLQYFSTVY